MTKAYPNPRTRWPLLLALLMFHGLLLVGWQLRQVGSSHRPGSIALRLVPPDKPPEHHEPLWYRAPVGDFFPEPRRVEVPAPEITVAAPAVSSIAVAAAVPASAASRPPPLRLNLPTNMLAAPHVPTAREQALNDPRTRPVKVTPEYAIADAAGTLPVERSTSTDGMESTIVRQGRTRCTRISKPRIAALDPTDSRLRDLPAMAGDCPHK